jgi:PiT family inorganic phosphate transporter
MVPSLLFVIIVIIIAWMYDFLNGANDRANAIATTVATRALPPIAALTLASTLDCAGAFVNTKVAETIGKGIVPSEHMTQLVLIAGLIGASFWVAVCTWSGIPISVTHSLVGGLMGSGIAYGGISILKWDVLIKKVFLGIILAPAVGFIAGGIILFTMFWLFQKVRPKTVNNIFRRGQILSASFMAFTHGMNDAQNAMGVITAALLSAKYITEFRVPFWVIVGSGTFMGLGTFMGGRRVMKTLGWKVAKLQPIHGFSAETGSAIVIIINSFLGMPISTTHVVASAVMGSTAIQKLSQIRWLIAGRMIVAWIVTIPGAGIVGALAYLLLGLII